MATFRDGQTTPFQFSGASGHGTGTASVVAINRAPHGGTPGLLLFELYLVGKRELDPRETCTGWRTHCRVPNDGTRRLWCGQVYYDGRYGGSGPCRQFSESTQLKGVLSKTCFRVEDESSGRSAQGIF